MLYHKKNPHGGDLYGGDVAVDFSANINPLGTPLSVQQAVEDSLSSLCRYPDPYCRHLVAAISAFELVPRSFILCGCGAAELIFSYCAALKPKKALELAPTFAEYSVALETYGCEVRRYPLYAENDFILDDRYPEYLEETDAEVAFLCNPNNPTGQLLERERLAEILSICQRRGLHLFLDECFLDLTDEEEAVTMKPFLKDHPELFILKAFTKSYGMAGLRLGYCLCSDEELLAKMGNSVQPWNISTPAQVAGVAALKEQDFLKAARKLIRRERQWLCERITSLGIAVYPSKVNYLLLYSERPLGELLMKHGIQIRDCSNYHGLDVGWYRIAVKTHEENEKLVDALESIMRGEPRQK